jgi:hypothetical protein
MDQDRLYVADQKGDEAAAVSGASAGGDGGWGGGGVLHQKFPLSGGDLGRPIVGLFSSYSRSLFLL